MGDIELPNWKSKINHDVENQTIDAEKENFLEQGKGRTSYVGDQFENLKGETKKLFIECQKVQLEVDRIKNLVKSIDNLHEIIDENEYYAT